jgi:anti-sigma regulatory factor (Ser/Thr protein kinase)
MDWNEGPDGLVQAYRRSRWGWIAGAWGAIYTFEAARHLVNTHFSGRPPSLLWLAVSATSVTLWAVLTPLMLWLGRRAPLDREDRGRRVAIHVAALLVIVTIDTALQARLWGYRGTSTFTSLFFTVMVVDGFSYATVVAIAHVQRANALYRERVRAQAELDRELTTARLRALEMQLQPHFLFNTLHAVGALVRAERADDAVRSLATLGHLLRATLAGGDQHEIALGDEIALAHRYLELQKIRFADRLQVEVAIAPEVERARVPRLILQPLLENAVRHGVERSRTAVAIEVRACAREQRLELTVRDHGGVREAPSRGQGIGLANTRARLATLYGSSHRFELTPTEGGGLAICIEIPLVLAPVAAGPLELEGELSGEPGGDIEALT